MTRWKGVVATALVFGAAALFHASYAFHGVALFDEGLLCDGAWRVRDGVAIGRDAFVPYGPASYWILAPCFAWFGQNLFVERVVVLLAQAACDAALFGLAWKRSTFVGALLAAALLAVAHGSLHKSFLVVAATLGLVAADQLAARRVAVAGALAGGAFLFRHDVGAFSGVALAVARLFEGAPVASPPPADRAPSRGPRRLRDLVALALGFAAVVGPAFLFLLARGLDVRAWWAHEWQRIAVQERIEVEPLAAGDESLRWGRSALLAALIGAPLVHGAWAAGAVVRLLVLRRPHADGGDAFRLASALLGLLLLNQARLIPSANHLFQGFAPVALALGDLLARRGRSWAPQLLFAAIVAGVTTWAALGKPGPYSGTFNTRIAGAVELALPSGGVMLSPARARDLEQLVAAIQRRVPPDGTLVPSPGCPLVGFLAQRRLAIPYAEPSYYYFDERLQREAIAAIERSGARVFVEDRSPAGSRPANFDFATAAPLVARFVAEHFAPVEEFGPYALWQRVR